MTDSGLEAASPFGAAGSVRLQLDWRPPLDAFAPLAQMPGALLLLSGAPGRRSLIFAEPERLFDGNGRESLAAARAALSTGGWVAGLLNYELGAALEPSFAASPEGGQPDVVLGLYRAVAVFDHQAQRLTLHGEPAASGRLADILGSAPYAATNEAPMVTRLERARSRGDVEAAVQRAVDYVHAGDIYQANISQRFDVTMPEGDEPFRAFHRLSTDSPAPFAAFFRPQTERVIATHSPERFLRIDTDGSITSQPIKGTRPRGSTGPDDALQAHELLKAEKDRAENLMIVDLVRNDLARVCVPGSVHVPALYALESYANVHHLVSTVTGRLARGRDAFDAIRAAFPPGSVTGAPKMRAMEIIAELEGEERGAYCGAIGYVGADGAADFNVMIRSITFTRERERWRARFRSGAGIVAESDPRAEYDEMLTKASSIIAALGAEESAE